MVDGVDMLFGAATIATRSLAMSPARSMSGESPASPFHRQVFFFFILNEPFFASMMV